MRFADCLAFAAVLCFSLTSSACPRPAPSDPGKWFASILRDLQDDNTPWNCSQAMAYLYDQRDSLADKIRMAIPTSDWQGQLALIRILCETKSFQPDDDFLGLVVDKLCEGRTLFLAAHYSTKHELAAYLIHCGINRPEKLTALLKPKIPHADLESLWLIAHILDRLGTLQEVADSFTPEVLVYVISNLRDDSAPYNATFAVRTCLLLREKVVPNLIAESEQGDGQSRKLSSLLLSAMGGNGQALGEINSLCPLGSPHLKRGIQPLPDI